jgi:hypothetical protein
MVRHWGFFGLVVCCGQIVMRVLGIILVAIIGVGLSGPTATTG